ncbi:nmrA-like negative transcriptional regulator family protein [Artemisia annua]|uniref:NmrA-like negative transcriptional regulator family protein n=1 Tax=Artemisia annua TaxID=35608 RepID=A0A2U1MJR4_ARTAN|nr:nmrA-like negative transcriptional regulator family protein [Artemisia annua]
MAESNIKQPSSILIIGVTGRLGYELAAASLQASHPTFCLVRPSSLSDKDKAHKVQVLSDSGAVIIEGSLHDEESLFEAVKQVNVVICAVNSKQVLDQKPLISAIKKAGCIERFIPSEFGLDPDITDISGMDQGFYSRKSEIRRLVEAEGIPHTYVSCNFFMSYLLPSLVQPGLKAPPRDKVSIFGDGNVKGMFVGYPYSIVHFLFCITSGGGSCDSFTYKLVNLSHVLSLNNQNG